MSNSKLTDKINKLKKLKNAVILCHCYQNPEIDQVADFIGDSLYLSQQAANTNADMIIFAGVYFMAETAKILSPKKKIILPRLESGCLMADMINIEELRNFKAQYPKIPVVCYVNSTADIKAESDICCTSANAVQVVKSLQADKILFIPDRGLGMYVQSQIPDIEIIPYYGYCPTHMRILPDDIIEKREKYKNAEVLVHPECHMEVIKMANFIGSTAGTMKRVRQSSLNNFIIATESGVIERLKRDLPEKEIILASDKAICENMKWNTLEDILHSLEKETPEIQVAEEISQKAYTSIKKMLDIL